jgi:hypothetical protein
MADETQTQTFDPVSELRTRYPGVANEPDEKIREHLSDPNNFRAAFPEYKGLDDATIVRNMRATSPAPLTPEQRQQVLQRNAPPTQFEKENAPGFWGKAVSSALNAHPMVASALDTLGGIGTGAVKGAGHTLDALAPAVNKIPGIGEILSPEEGIKAWNIATHPNTLPEKIGYGSEQAAEFAVPGGAVTRGAKAAEAAIDAARMAPLANSALKVLSRAALEGAAGGTVAAAQGQDPKTAALFSAVLPVVGAALKPAAGALAEKAAPALANKLLRPVPTQLENAARFGRNPGKAIADEGIVATGYHDLLNKIGEKQDQVGNQISSLLTSAKNTKPIDAGKIVNANIDSAIQDVLNGKLEGGQALVDRLEEMRGQLTQQRQLVNGKVQNFAAKNLNLSPVEAHALKVQVGKSAKWTGQAFDEEVNQVKRGIYRDLNQEIQQAVPEVKGLQDRYGNLREAEDAAQRETARNEARHGLGLNDLLTGLGGAGLGALSGSVPRAALWGAGLAATNKALRSPLARTLEVQALKKAPGAVSPEMTQFFRNAVLAARSANRQ